MRRLLREIPLTQLLGIMYYLDSKYLLIAIRAYYERLDREAQLLMAITSASGINSSEFQSILRSVVHKYR